MRFSLDFCPERRAISERLQPKLLLRKRIRASLARPSKGGALTRTLRLPSLCKRISFFDAPGTTLIVRVRRSASSCQGFSIVTSLPMPFFRREARLRAQIQTLSRQGRGCGHNEEGHCTGRPGESVYRKSWSGAPWRVGGRGPAVGSISLLRAADFLREGLEHQRLGRAFFVLEHPRNAGFEGFCAKNALACAWLLGSEPGRVHQLK